MATTDRTVAGSAVGLRRDAIGPGRITDVGLVHLDGDL